MKKVIIVLAALLTLVGCETSENNSCATDNERTTMCEEAFTAALEEWYACNEDHDSFTYLEGKAELNIYKSDCLNESVVECIIYDDLEKCLSNDWRCLEDSSFVEIPDACWSTIL